MEFLRLAVNLFHCSVDLIHCVFDDSGAASPTLSHMHLQVFMLAAGGFLPKEVVTFLDEPSLPALRRLEIPEPWFCPEPAANIAAWILHSNCDLEQLHITHSRLSELAYRELLPSVPNISVDENDHDYFDSL
jgi:hypothetical protein